MLHYLAPLWSCGLTCSPLRQGILAYGRTRGYFYAYYITETLTATVCEGSMMCLSLAYVVSQHVPASSWRHQQAVSWLDCCAEPYASSLLQADRVPEARRAAGPTARRSCRRANHCPLMPALALRQAHSCRPRPRPVLAPHPDAAAQNTEHAPRPSRGSGTRAPTGHTGPQAPRDASAPTRRGGPQGRARAGDPAAGNNGASRRAHVSRGPPPTRTRYSQGHE